MSATTLAWLLFFSSGAEAKLEASARSRARLSPQEILRGIEEPWSGPLAELRGRLAKQKSYVVWIHVPAERPLDLRSSDHFRRWALATPFGRMSISHNMIAYRCPAPGGGVVEGATGMTGSTGRQEARALLAGYGLSVFFSVFTDGHLNPQREVGDYVMKNLRKRGAVFAAFEVAPRDCAAMRGFLRRFIAHPRRPFERFTNMGDPERFEGGGCVSLAAALLRRARLLEPLLPELSRRFRVARYLLGGNLAPVHDVEPPRTPWLNGRRRSVSLNLVWTNRWDTEPSDFPGSVGLSQIDPEKMLYLLRTISQAYLETLPAQRRAREAAWLAAGPLGLREVTTAEYDYADTGRSLQFSSAPIDDQFDPGMARVGAATREWARSALASGDRLSLASVAGMPLLVLERP